MKNQFRLIKIDEVAEVISGGTPSTSEISYWNGSIPWITPKDLSGYTKRRISKGERSISIDGLKNSSARLLPKDTVLLTSRAPIGYVAIAGTEVTTNQGFKNLVLKEGHDPDFYYYLLKLNKEKIESYASGSTFKEISASVLKQLEFSIPPYSIQKQISKTLGLFDEKIELNNQINESLELMAKIIFKDWFIDFGPVRAKSIGTKPFGMDDKTASLFPESFEESELGQIPKGWRVGKLDDAGSVKHGYAYKGEYFSDDSTEEILLTPGNFKIGGGFKSDKFKYYAGPQIEGYVLNEDDLIITMTDLSKEGDTLGYPALVPKRGNLKFLHNQRIGLFALKNKRVKLWIYNLLQTPAYRSWILGSCTGSTVKHTSPSRILEYKMVFPSPELMEAYQSLALPFYESIKANEIENFYLIKLRELLLPKLLLGEVIVKEN